MNQLTPEEIAAHLQSLPGWQMFDNSIGKDFQFADFNEAFAFLTRIAMLSEKMNHHADWSGVYNKVSIRLSTHDAGGVTQKDIKMATAIAQYAEAAKAS
jgi:4a-hydroxytetrahydrobiopterin dehydratase